MGQKVLILGSNGFIGKNICNYLSNLKRFTLYNPKRQELNLLDTLSCENYLKKIAPDIVIHVAINIHSTEDSLRMFFNIYNLKTLYGRLIQIGSGAEYDKRQYIPLIKESNYGLSVPTDTYGLSKYLISKELQSNINSDRYLNLRIFGIYGPHEDYYRRFISNNIWRVMSGLKIRINQDMYFDYIHVADLIKLLVLILDGKKMNSISYNFCSGKPILLSNLAKTIATLMNYKDPIEIKKKGLNLEYSGDPSMILSELNNFTFSAHEKNIKDLILHYQNFQTPELINLFRKITNDQ